MKRLLFGALLLLALVSMSHVRAHGHDDDDDDDQEEGGDQHEALMPTTNSMEEIRTTWSRKRKEAFVASWERSEHDCDEKSDEHSEHCEDHQAKIANLEVTLSSMSMDLLDGQVKQIYDEMVSHAKKAAKSMGNSFKALQEDKEYMSMMKDTMGEMGVDSGEDHEHDMMKSLLADHIEGQLNDHMHGSVLNYTQIYNSLPQTAKYRTTGNNPGIKDHLFNKLKTDHPAKYALLKTRSAKTLKDAAADMKSHALRYNRFATAFEAHKHK